MKPVAIDASVASAWYFEDEQTSFTDSVLSIVPVRGAIAPRLFAYEIRNTVLFGVRRGRTSWSRADDFLSQLATLPIRLVAPISYDEVLYVAKRHNLTFYDAAYLDLALREGVPLASLDKALCEAAIRTNVTLFQSGS